MIHEYDYSKLRGKIKEVLGTEGKLASILNISPASISAKLKSQVPFSIKEMDAIISILNIDTQMIYEYFFTKKVENNSTNNLELSEE